MIIFLLVNLVSACINLKILYANSVEMSSTREGVVIVLIRILFHRCHAGHIVALLPVSALHPFR